LEAIGQFDDAADAYEQYVRFYEKSGEHKPLAKRGRGGKHGKKEKVAEAKPAAAEAPAQVWDEGKAQVALFNAATYREGLGQYKSALRDREHYLELWPNAKDAEAIFLSIADLYERTGAYS